MEVTDINHQEITVGELIHQLNEADTNELMDILIEKLGWK
jgi:hypothetical protein